MVSELERVIKNLKEAIYLMDTYGRSNEGCNSQLLWNEQWEKVRKDIYFSLVILERLIKE